MQKLFVILLIIFSFAACKKKMEEPVLDSSIKFVYVTKSLEERILEADYIFGQDAFYENGLIINKDGEKLNGIMATRQASGQLMLSGVKEGRYDGEQIIYFADGMKAVQVKYKYGIPEGTAYAWYPDDGSLRYLSKYKDGAEYYMASYAKGGALLAEHEITDGIISDGYWVIAGEKHPLTPEEKEWWAHFNGKSHIYVCGDDAFVEDNLYVDSDSTPLSGLLECSFKDGGLINSYAMIKNGNHHGLLKYFNENLVPYLQISYNNNLAHGQAIYFYPTGEIKTVMSFKNGLIDGYFRNYTSTDTLYAYSVYKNGRLIRAYKLDNDGDMQTIDEDTINKANEQFEGKLMRATPEFNKVLE